MKLKIAPIENTGDFYLSIGGAACLTGSKILFSILLNSSRAKMVTRFSTRLANARIW